jgi:hypothetical protein
MQHDCVPQSKAFVFLVVLVPFITIVFIKLNHILYKLKRMGNNITSKHLRIQTEIKLKEIEGHGLLKFHRNAL